MLSTRLGDLTEAEVNYKRALQLAEQIHEPVYISLWNSYLANSLQAQGKLDEAKPFILNSLKIARTKHITFCIGFALITLGQFHIAQATSIFGIQNSEKKSNRLSSQQLLERARDSLLRGLALEGLEAETRTEGQLALAQASFLLGEISAAQQQAQQAIDEAHHYEQTWLLACGQRLMGNILSSQRLYDSADTYFTQALETLQRCEMRLEEARTLRSFGESLLERAHLSKVINNEYYDQGLPHLREARKIFEQCNAVLDLDLVDRLLEVEGHLTPVHT
jgi:tetratricopeptide (TPR) repeat protein